MTDNRIVTVTLHPVLERTLVAHYLAVGYQNQAQEAERLDPSGAGVNIARALHRLGADVHALVLLGDDAVGRAYGGLLAEYGFESTVLHVQGATPSDTCILDTGSDQETHLLARGAAVDQGVVQQVLRALVGIVEPGNTVVLAGPLPPGAPEDVYARLVDAVQGAGARAVLAASGPALDATLPARPSLVILNQVECEGFCNYPVRVLDDVVSCAQRLRGQGAGAALIEMGRADRALLAGDEGRWLVELPGEAQGTSTGIWEATLAGYLAGRLARQPIPASLELGAAAAGYAADEVGAAFGSPAEVEEYRPGVEVRPVEDGE
jgi:1-phosphofructokinase